MAAVVPKHPCSTCPYLRSTPPGIWHPDEYLKLATYDDDRDVTLMVFHCHQENVTDEPTLCRGWLGVHVDHPAVRLALALGLLDPDDWQAIPDSDPTLYSSGTEACERGLAGCEDMSEDALRAAARLVRRGRFKVG